MILHPQRYIDEARPAWTELEKILDDLDRSPEHKSDYEGLQRMHYLYRKVSYDLVQLRTDALDNYAVAHLEGLVARAYAEIYATRHRARFSFRKLLSWLFVFPRTFRLHVRYFIASTSLFFLGALVGALLLVVDPVNKEVVLPFSHLLGDPSERVAEEEKISDDDEEDPMQEVKARFSAQLMQNNIRVSFFCFALGITFGIGTSIILFYNGVILGMVCLDYVLAGESEFLLAWLLPHGSIEIPAILIAGQAGLLLGVRLLPGLSASPFAVRMRKTSKSLVTFLLAICALLIWAGIVEAFLSQYHAPVVPYSLKIFFGAISLLLFFSYLAFTGRKKETDANHES